MAYKPYQDAAKLDLAKASAMQKDFTSFMDMPWYTAAAASQTPAPKKLTNRYAAIKGLLVGNVGKTIATMQSVATAKQYNDLMVIETLLYVDSVKGIADKYYGGQTILNAQFRVNIKREHKLTCPTSIEASDRTLQYLYWQLRDMATADLLSFISFTVGSVVCKQIQKKLAAQKLTMLLRHKKDFIIKPGTAGALTQVVIVDPLTKEETALPFLVCKKKRKKFLQLVKQGRLVEARIVVEKQSTSALQLHKIKLAEFYPWRFTRRGTVGNLNPKEKYILSISFIYKRTVMQATKQLKKVSAQSAVVKQGSLDQADGYIQAGRCWYDRGQDKTRAMTRLQRRQFLASECMKRERMAWSVKFRHVNKVFGKGGAWILRSKLSYLNAERIAADIVDISHDTSTSLTKNQTARSLRLEATFPVL